MAIKLEIKKVRPQAVLPFYANPGDAGMDLCAAEDVRIGPGQSKVVATGLVLAIPLGYEVQIRPRSGLSLKTRLRLPNSPGTIDSGYRDELGVLLYNASPETCDPNLELTCREKENRAGTYLIKKGDRIAQMILAPVSQANLCLVEEFTPGGVEDRGGGFGSSGARVEDLS